MDVDFLPCGDRVGYAVISATVDTWLTRSLAQFAAIVVLHLMICYWASTPTAGVSMRIEILYDMPLRLRMLSIDSVGYSSQSIRP